MQAEAPPRGFHDHPRTGYGWDECSAEVVLTRMTVRDGRLVLHDGMSYRLLVLPESPTMTLALLGKIKDLVEAGTTVVGPRPVGSPRLSGYPSCDEDVKELAGKLWGDCDGQKVKEHRVGLGRVVWGVAPESLLAGSGVRPDFESRSNLRYIHRALGDTDLYFVSNPLPSSLTAVCSFRVTGKQPEFWWPDRGRVEAASMFTAQDGATRVLVPLEASGSVFVVFRKHGKAPSSILSVAHDGKAVLSTSAQPPSKIVVRKAVYGVLSDPLRTRDVRAKVQQFVDAGEDRFEVARLAAGDDPAFGIVKTLVVDYSIGDLPGTARGTDPETIVLVSVPVPRRSVSATFAVTRTAICFSRRGSRDIMSCRQPRDRGRSRCPRCPRRWRSLGLGKLRSRRTAERPRRPRSTSSSRGPSTPIPVSSTSPAWQPIPESSR